MKRRFVLVLGVLAVIALVYLGLSTWDVGFVRGEWRANLPSLGTGSTFLSHTATASCEIDNQTDGIVSAQIEIDTPWGTYKSKIVEIKPGKTARLHIQAPTCAEDYTGRPVLVAVMYTGYGTTLSREVTAKTIGIR